MQRLKRKVLVICTANSCRSQMAEGLINHELGDEWLAYSAGTNPSSVNPRAVQVMAEIGIDISGHHSKSVDVFLDRDDLDLVVTVCDHAREVCPAFPGNVSQEHIGFDDPAYLNDQPDEVALPVLRRIRDQIRLILLDYLKARFERNL